MARGKKVGCEVGDVVHTQWGKACVGEVYGDGDLGCVWEGWDGSYTIRSDEVVRFKVNDIVDTEWGEACVARVHDGDIECTWEGWDDHYTIRYNEAKLKK